MKFHYITEQTNQLIPLVQKLSLHLQQLQCKHHSGTLLNK